MDWLWWGKPFTYGWVQGYQLGGVLQLCLWGSVVVALALAGGGGRMQQGRLQTALS